MVMKNQSGFIWIPLIIIALITAAVVGTGAVAVYGEAPTCPSVGTTARSESEIGDAIQAGGATVTDGEATTIAQRYFGDQINDARICFTPGEGHLSGSVPLGAIKPTIYVSAGVDLTGSIPQATNLKIQLGSLPNVPFISNLLNSKLNSLIADNLSRFDLDRTYSAEFAQGSVTIR